MSQDESSTQKITKISLTGDKEKCGHCSDDDKKLQSFAKVGYSYEYTDVHSEKGQQQLKDWGIQEGQSVDIPIIKAETCVGSTPETKRCKTTNWKDEYWKDLESGKLPDEVTDV